MSAIDLNNQAQSLMNQGAPEKALPFFIKALELKIKATGQISRQSAVSYNALGECYLKLGEYEKAKKNLDFALEHRKTEGENIDTRVTRDNLGHVCEETGDLEGARRERKHGKNLCSFNQCNDDGTRSLKACGKCKAIWYCGNNCQNSDWSRHKK
mmetsp:Transcript_2234/g.4402  ORF Transcript_2234/g.4402 Transcript_2234/m.4402 type:complete len:155 (-) Transcript_2234:160-624(-)